MDFYNTEEISKLEDRLTEVLQNEYGGDTFLWVNVDKIELSYIVCEPGDKPTVTIKIRYGYHSDGEDSWQKELELYYEEDNLDFIAGQFYQALVERENETFEDEE